MIVELDKDYSGICNWIAGLGKVAFVTTNGCFDLMHMGHVSLLQFCHEKALATMRRPPYADIFVPVLVLVNTDESVARLKPGRPIIPWKERASMVDEVKGVSFVLPLHDDTPSNLLSYLSPVIHVKDASYQFKNMPEARVVQGGGGSVKYAPIMWPRSTTETIKEILMKFKVDGDGNVVNKSPMEGSLQ